MIFRIYALLEIAVNVIYQMKRCFCAKYLYVELHLINDLKCSVTELHNAGCELSTTRQRTDTTSKMLTTSIEKHTKLTTTILTTTNRDQITTYPSTGECIDSLKSIVTIIVNIERIMQGMLKVQMTLQLHTLNAPCPAVLNQI